MNAAAEVRNRRFIGRCVGDSLRTEAREDLFGRSWVVAIWSIEKDAWRDGYMRATSKTSFVEIVVMGIPSANCVRVVLAAFLVAGASSAKAEETSSPVMTSIIGTTTSGYVDTTASWTPPTQQSHVQPVPEPSSVALLALGAIAVGFVAKRRK